MPVIIQSFFSFNQEKIITFNWQVAIFITKEISSSLFISVSVSEISKTKSFLMELGFGSFCRFCVSGDEFLYNTTVLTQNIVYISYIRGVITVEFVIVSVAAPVVAEFFVHTAFEGFAAFKTGFVGGFTHDKGDLVCLKLGRIIRLQTLTNG